ncbi:hypothetical protein CEXT_172701 [Caerostris extrusa]|uniref:Uncharacterized protein n=1 Tax=Caerostris extrusa TaxID=172846 RepID=A0AAV4W6X5_CAEEX|nr:hypothetical protein CEXT_172701 [Caerostris extrusa]
MYQRDIAQAIDTVFRFFLQPRRIEASPRSLWRARIGKDLNCFRIARFPGLGKKRDESFLTLSSRKKSPLYSLGLLSPTQTNRSTATFSMASKDRKNLNCFRIARFPELGKERDESFHPVFVRKNSVSSPKRKLHFGAIYQSGLLCLQFLDENGLQYFLK